MKRPAFTAMPAATFAIAVAAMILAAPLAQAQNDIETNCRSGGGEYLLTVFFLNDDHGVAVRH